MLCIVQARMSSHRLPGKALVDIRGRALLGRVLDRLARAGQLTKILVATSSRVDDQPIADFCAGEQVECVRGSLDDVAARFLQAAGDADAFVRISGDSPLIDPALVDQAATLFMQEACDLVTNVLVRTFPKGQSVEVLRADTFRRAYDSMTSPDQREHVTRIYYQQPHRFRTRNFASDAAAGDINLSVDTAGDVALIEAILDRCGNRPGGWREIVLAYKALVTA